MTIQALAWAIDQQLPHKPKLVLMALANHADHSNGKVDFVPSTIAWESSTPQGSIWRFLGALERNGFLSHDQRGETAEEREYWLLIDRNPSLPWSWGAEGSNEEDSAGPFEQAETPSIAVQKFDRSKQTEKRVAAAKAIEDAKPKDVFVIEGTPAFEAWSAWKTIDKGYPWRLAGAKQIVDGKLRYGWRFPTLFPPGHGEGEMGGVVECPPPPSAQGGD